MSAIAFGISFSENDVKAILIAIKKKESTNRTICALELGLLSNCLPLQDGGVLSTLTKFSRFSGYFEPHFPPSVVVFSSIGGEGEPNLLVFALCRYLGLNQTEPGTNKLGVKRYREVIKGKILQP